MKGTDMTIEMPDQFASACQWADSYRALGLAVIPAAGREKIPLGRWREFQNGIPQTVHDRWYGADGEHRSNYRMGFLTGAASLGDGWKLLVIDLDEKGSVSGSATWDHWIAENELGCDPETWRARTGGGGQHIHFRYPAHLSIRNTQETIAGIDVRAEGGFVIAPPSMHQNGKSYTWLFSPFETELAEAPQWLLDKVGAVEALPLAATPAPSSARSSSSPSSSTTSSPGAQAAPAAAERPSTPAQATDAWGHIVDGRDAYMRDMIWAAIVDWYRECPIPPSARESEEKLLEVYAVYERKVRPQAAGSTLDDEGRGLSAFRDKWAYAMRQWDSKVAAAAKEEAVQPAGDDDTVTVDPGEADPVDLWAKFDPPALPEGLLPPLIERFARVQGATMGADPGGMAMAALAACAAAISDRIRIKVKRHDDWTECARLWVALIGTPSTKKSPIIGQAIRPIARIDGAMVRTYLAKLAEYNELSKEERKGSCAPQQRRLRIEDTTIEAAQEVLMDSPDGVLLIQDELSGWFGAMDKYSGSRGAAKDRGFWLQSFNGGQNAINRIGRGVKIIGNLSISMLGGIQPEAVRAVAREAVDDGLLQRLLPILLKPATVGKDEEKSKVVEQYDRLVERLHNINPSGIASFGTEAGQGELILCFDDGAQRLRQELEQQHLELMSVEAVNRKLAAHIGKYDGIFARLCVVWHCVENEAHGMMPDLVTEETARRVATFLHEYLLPHALSFYAGVLDISDDQDALAAIAGYVLAHGLKRLTRRDLQIGLQKITKGMTAPEAQRLLEQMESFGWVTQVPGPRLTSPPQWLVNPQCHVRFAERKQREQARRAQTRAIIAKLMGGKK